MASRQHRRGTTPFAQRGIGAFAMAAVVLLLGLVAAMVRGVVTDTAGSVHATAVAEQSVDALYAAESGLEAVLGALKTSPPNSLGTLNDIACSAAAATGTPYAAGGATFTYQSLVSGPSGCGNTTPNTCASCTVSVLGQKGLAQRLVNARIEYSQAKGVTGFGSDITQAFNTSTAPAIVLGNLAYRKTMPGVGSSNVQACSTSSCTSSGTILWTLDSGGGANATGDQALLLNVASTGINSLSMNLSDSGGTPAPRNYAFTGTQLESNNTSYGVSLSTRSTTGCSAPGTNCLCAATTYKNTNCLATYDANYCPATCATTMTGYYGVQGNTTNSGANNTGTVTNSWCADGADTLIFLFSGSSSSTTTSLTSIAFGSADPSKWTRIARQPSFAGDVYSEIWGLYDTGYTSSPGAETYASKAGGTSSFGVSGVSTYRQAVAVTQASASTSVRVGSITNLLSSGSVRPLVAIEGDATVIPAGTTIVSSSGGSTPTVTLSAAPTRALTTTDVLIASTVTSSSALPTLLTGAALSSRGGGTNPNVNCTTPQYPAGTTVTDINTSSRQFNTSKLPTNASGTGALPCPLIKGSGNAAQVVLASTVVATPDATYSAFLYPTVGETVQTIPYTSGSTSGPTFPAGTTVTAVNTNPSSGAYTYNLSNPPSAALSAANKSKDVIVGTIVLAPSPTLTTGLAAGPSAYVSVSPQYTGAFASNTYVTSIANCPTGSTSCQFTVSAPPTTVLQNAVVLQSGVNRFFGFGSTTSYTVTSNSSSNQWASGFACLRGVKAGTLNPTGLVTGRISAWWESNF